MIPYFILFGVFAIAAALTHVRLNRSYTPGLLASAAFLIVIIGLRYEVGGDWFGYAMMFRRIALVSLNDAIHISDPAYALINWLTAQLGLGIWAVNLVCAAIFVYGLLELCRDQPNPPLALLVAIPYLVIVVAMGYTRQSAALGLTMAALSQYFRGSIGRVAISLGIAASFHKSAIIVIPLIAMAASRRRALTIFLLGVIAIMTYYLLVASSLDRLITNYVAANYGSSGAAIRIGMNLVPAAIFLRWSKRFGMEREERRLWTIYSLGSFVSLLLLLLTPSSTAVDRISLYLIPLQIVALSRLPTVFSRGTAPNMALKSAVIVYTLLVQVIWLNFAENAPEWLPYRNFLMEQGV